MPDGSAVICALVRKPPMMMYRIGASMSATTTSAPK